MNPNYGKTGTSLNNFDFDLGIGSNRSRSLNDQKNKPNSYGSSYSSTSSYSQSGARSGMGTAGTAPSWQPNKPSWTPQLAPARTKIGTRSELGGPPSMVGDIFGKSWSSVAPAKTGGSVGIVNKDPHLFGDLVSSALGQNKSNGNAPLKSAAPASGPAKSSFSMGSMADSLPRTSEAAKGSGSSWGSSEKFGSFAGASSTGSTYGANDVNKSMNFGGPSGQGSGSAGGSGARGGAAIGGGGSGLGMSSKKDPFGSLFDLGAKPSGGASLNSASKTKPTSSEDYGFGDLKNASISGASVTPPNAFAYSSSTSMESNQSRSQPSGSDSFDMFFSPSTGSGVGAKATLDQSGDQQSSGGNDWGFDSEFGGGAHDVGSTTELEGLPPPPAGVSASSAKIKGLDNYKQGQYADAIKWLSWAVILLQKTGNANGTTEVLTCRASCYKEVGEYKKAVADCTSVLEHDGENVAVLVQRALLYESMEKYKLGAEDLRTVMKLDPANRVARSTIHRLTKMID